MDHYCYFLYNCFNTPIPTNRAFKLLVVVVLMIFYYLDLNYYKNIKFKSGIVDSASVDAPITKVSPCTAWVAVSNINKR